MYERSPASIRFDRQKAIVTGGYMGMGNCVARYFALYGAEVCLLDRCEALPEAAKALAAETGGTFHSVIADFSTSEARQTAFAQALDALGGRMDSLSTAPGSRFSTRPKSSHLKIIAK